MALAHEANERHCKVVATGTDVYAKDKRVYVETLQSRTRACV